MDSVAREARQARAAVEAALDRARWPWSPRLSLELDRLLALEERGDARAPAP
jgi:hypothetical protein